jgi:N-acetylmuramoyl-L-alanine amidase
LDFSLMGLLAIILFFGGAGVLWAEPPTSLESTEETTDVLLSTTDVAPSSATLRIVHPREGASLPFVRQSFVFGRADPRGRLFINGRLVSVHPGGGFLTMVNYAPGPFVIQAELRLPEGSVQTLTRRVTVAGPPGVPAASPLNVTATEPSVDMSLRPGDEVWVQAYGSPGQEAAFRLPDVKGWFPMPEGSPGSYRGVYVVQREFHGADVPIQVALTDKKRGRRVVSDAPGRLSRWPDDIPTVVEVSSEPTVLRAAPAPAPGDKAGYLFFPPAGVRFQATARRGEEWRVRLSPSLEGWIGVKETVLLPRGTPRPRALIGAISFDGDERSVRVRTAVNSRIPFQVRSSPEEGWVDVSFYGAAANTDWVHHGGAGLPVDRVEWFQDDSETYRLRVWGRPYSWWGIDGRYENGNFILELRRPPTGGKVPDSLAGLKVAVDPGHSSDTGAVGPTGLLEKDANRGIAECLAYKLKAEGAEVVWIRPGDAHVPLYDRPKLAWAARADVLISVHNNALPEGANPFERNGFGVYYYHPYSLDLAREIHGAYREVFSGRTPRRALLRDDGLHWGNLALPRTPQMPSVLTESAYVIWPPEEALLRRADFQCDCADAMVTGLKRYVRGFRLGSDRRESASENR